MSLIMILRTIHGWHVNGDNNPIVNPIKIRYVIHGCPTAETFQTTYYVTSPASEMQT